MFTCSCFYSRGGRGKEWNVVLGLYVQAAMYDRVCLREAGSAVTTSTRNWRMGLLMHAVIPARVNLNLDIHSRDRTFSFHS